MRNEETVVTEDMVNHPSHYASQSADGHEPIELCELYPFAIGNAIKYLIRAGHKASAPEAQDLRKAKWYIDRGTRHGTADAEPVRYFNEEDYRILRAFCRKNDYVNALFPGAMSELTPASVEACIKLIDKRLEELDE